MTDIVTISFLIAIGSFTFVCILQQPGEIFAWYPILIGKLPDWISKPMGLCEKCFSGQAALWLFPFWLSEGPYDPVMHILFVLLTIFQTTIVTILYRKLTGLEISRYKKMDRYTPPEINQQ
jgi:hypothetical protein